MKYKHALFLNPYIAHKDRTRSIMELFPPTGLEYVAGSAKGHVDKITLLDLRYEEELKDVDKLVEGTLPQHRVTKLCGNGFSCHSSSFIAYPLSA